MAEPNVVTVALTGVALFLAAAASIRRAGPALPLLSLASVLWLVATIATWLADRAAMATPWPFWIASSVVAIAGVGALAWDHASAVRTRHEEARADRARAFDAPAATTAAAPGLRTSSGPTPPPPVAH